MIGSGFDRRDSGNDGSGPASAGAKVRVYDLAKEFGLANKDLLAKIRAFGIEVANHMSSLDASDVERIRRAVERERQESLVETRLNDTVIRRRSRVPGGAPARPRPVAEPAKPAAPPAPAQAAPEIKVVFAVPEPPTPAPVVVESLPVVPAPVVQVEETADQIAPPAPEPAPLVAAPEAPATEEQEPAHLPLVQDVRT